MASRKPRIAVVGTGGTISALGRHSLDLHEYSDFGEKLEVDELLARFPEAGAAAELVAVRFRAIGSSSITPADRIQLARVIDGTVAGDAAIDGVVVTHGTSTIEETAYFLHLTLKVGVSVVLVAAQPPADRARLGLRAQPGQRRSRRCLAGGTGPRRTCAPERRDPVGAGRDQDRQLAAPDLRTPDFGMLGYADADGTIAIYRRPVRRHAPEAEFDLSALEELPRVDIVLAYAGADGALIDAALAAGARGLVCSGIPAGKPTPAQRAALLGAIDAGVPVVLASRAGSGRAILRTNDREAGFIAADTLNAQKARVLLMLALTVTGDVHEIRRMFAEY